MSFSTPDIVIACALLAGFLLGGFTGFSGSLAFVAGSVSAAIAVRFSWSPVAGVLAQQWSRVLASLAILLVSFWIARVFVRKFVKLALAQPADFIFGSLIGLALAGGCALAAVWALAKYGILTVDSVILSGVKGLVG